MAERGHNGHLWRTLRQRVRDAADYLVCGICHREIDRRIRWPHPMSFSVDLIVPWSKGGDPHDPTNLRPAHLSCNSRRGAGRPTRRHWIADDTP